MPEERAAGVHSSWLLLFGQAKRSNTLGRRASGSSALASERKPAASASNSAPISPRQRIQMHPLRIAQERCNQQHHLVDAVGEVFLAGVGTRAADSVVVQPESCD